MRKINKTRKLTMNKQTVRRLSAMEMRSRRGGVAVVFTPLLEPDPEPWMVISIVVTVINPVITVVREIPVAG
ncbi:MAG: hypothetical protein GY765_42190 [bacterium]|nr:hypothetical protein [bacterium]